MMTRWNWVLSRMRRQLWVRATLIGILGVVTALVSATIERLIPWQFSLILPAPAVDSLLTIIASSMLAVTTFSLSVMTSAYGAASSGVTPRATPLLMEDPTTQNVLSVFIGSFLFSIVGIIVLKTGGYGDRGRVILFVVTIGIIALIVMALLRWIDHLTHLGRLGDTADQVEAVATVSLQQRRRQPCLGGVAWDPRTQPLPAGAVAVTAVRIGPVRFIDMAALSAWAEAGAVQVYVQAVPGTFVYPGTVLAWVVPEPTAPCPDTAAVAEAFDIARGRSFEQDPRFGVVVLAEIGARALSSAINDSGTALDVIGRLVRVLASWAVSAEGPEDSPEPVSHPQVRVPPLNAEDLLEDAFLIIGRDGAGLVEVQLRLQKALWALQRIGDDAFREAAAEQARLALERAEAALSLPADRERLRHQCRVLQADATAPAGGS